MEQNVHEPMAVIKHMDTMKMNGMKMNRMKMNGTNMDGMNMDGMNMNGMKMNGTNMDGMNMNEMKMSGMNMDGMKMNGMNLDGMKMNGMKMNGINMDGMNMNGMKMNGMNMGGMNMDGMKMPAMHFTPVTLTDFLVEGVCISSVNGIILAMLFVMVLTIVFEALNFWLHLHAGLKKSADRKPISRPVRAWILFKGASWKMSSLTLGYVIMLSVMSLNVWLLASAIIGSGLGHLFMRPFLSWRVLPQDKSDSVVVHDSEILMLANSHNGVTVNDKMLNECESDYKLGQSLLITDDSNEIG